MAKRRAVIVEAVMPKREYCGKPERNWFDPSKTVPAPQPKRHADLEGDHAANPDGMRRDQK